jgi:hypothetical protein
VQRWNAVARERHKALSQVAVLSNGSFAPKTAICGRAKKWS